MALPTLDELLEGDLFELLGIKEADDKVKKEILEGMMRTVDARVANRVASELSDEAAQEFKDTAEKGDPQALAEFLAGVGVDLPKIVSEEATKHRVEIIELARLAQEK